MPDAGQDIALTVPTPTPTDTPAASSAARIMGQVRGWGEECALCCACQLQ